MQESKISPTKRPYSPPQLIDHGRAVEQTEGWGHYVTEMLGHYKPGYPPRRPG